MFAVLGLALISLTSISTLAQDLGPAQSLGSLCRRNAAIDAAEAKKSHHGAVAQQSPSTPADGYDLSAHQTLSRVVLLIRENYVEPDRIKPNEMFLAALDNIQRSVAEVLVDDSQAPHRITVSVGQNSRAFDLGSIDELWEVTMALRDIFRFLQGHITDPNKQRDVEYAAINGMLGTLDPHSILLKPENFDEVKLSTKGEFGGLGIVISIRDGGLTIIAPIEGTPAGQAGLRAKDKIVKIGDDSTVNMALDEAVQILRGPPDTKVTIWVQRKGWTEPQKFVLTRAIIKIESVTSELLPDGIGYVKIKSFQGNTYDDLQAHLQLLRHRNNEKDLRGLVLDLRNNPGGLLDQAILVSDRFIQKGPLVITVGEGARRREVKNAHPGADEDSYPIAVLLNGGSASASEIVAGALKNHGRAVVIGQQSFGKGSVQVLYDFKDRSALKLTIAQYLTPGDLSIQSVGVVPDVAIIPAVIEKEGIHLFVDDDAPREKDLERHLSQHGPTTLTTSLVRMSHLSDKERQDLDPNSAANDARDEELAGNKFEYDFETRLAHDVLQASRSHDREAMLQEAMPLLQTHQNDTQKAISERMTALGVDWSHCEMLPTAPAEVSLAIDGGNRPIAAGSTVTLRARVHNKSDVALCQVYGTSKSENPMFRGLEFVFGHILPQHSREWQVKVKLPADMPPQADSIAIHVSSQATLQWKVQGEALVAIAAKPQPRFAYATRIDDSMGNGDGMLQPGEQVALRVMVHNIGQAAAEDVTVTLKNLAHSHVYLDSGRAKIGTILPGQCQEASLKFRVNGPGFVAPQAVVNAANDDEQQPTLHVAKAPKAGDCLSLKLGIYDNSFGATLAQNLNFLVMEPLKKSANLGLVKVVQDGPIALFSGTAIGRVDSLPEGDLGTLAKGSVVRALSMRGPYVEIELKEKMSAFVLAKDVQYVKGSVRGRKALHWTKMAPRAAPDLDVELPNLVVHQDSYRLHGSVRGVRPLKDLLIFVGDKKVFFKALDHIEPKLGSFNYAFEVPIKLKEGNNPVVIIARENEDLMSRKFFSILRRPKTAANAP